MDWRVLLSRYAWALTFRALFGSQRLSVDAKVAAVALAAPLVALGVGAQLWWILTGRGQRLNRLLGQGVIVAMPFPKRLPTAFREQLAEFLAPAPTDAGS